MEESGVNLFEQPMDVNHVKCLSQIHVKQTGPEGWFLFVESSGNVSLQREHGGYS